MKQRYNPFGYYDPFLMMMMNQRQDDLRDEDIIRRYDALKKAFEPPKKEEKKDKDKWETMDYFFAIVLFVGTATIFSTIGVLYEIVRLVEILHK